MPDIGEVVVKVMERAAEDDAYRAKLIGDTNAAIEEVAGRPIPEGINVVVHENTSTTLHFTLPYQPAADGELDDDELEHVAGGAKGSALGGKCDSGDALKSAPAGTEGLAALGFAAMSLVGYSALWT